MANNENRTKPFELAKLVNSRIHDYARDSLQRFALVFSLGSVAIGLLFAAAVRMFLMCPITRLHCDNSVWFAPLFSSFVGKLSLIIVLSVALLTFVRALCYVYAVFRRLHEFEAVHLQDEKGRAFLRRFWFKVRSISILGLLDRCEIWRKLNSELGLQRVTTPNSQAPEGVNILRTSRIATFKSEDEFIEEFIQVINITEDSLGDDTGNILRDTYRIVQRTLIIDRWYFVRALRLLLCSFILICALNFVFFIGAVFMPGEKLPPEATDRGKTLMLEVARDLIDLDIYKPSKRADLKNLPAIILVPGGRGKNYVVDPNTGIRFKGYNDLATRLAEVGFCVVVFDGRGQGRSEGLRSHEKGLEDLGKVLDYIDGLPEVDSSRISVFGRCGGAVIALHVASKDARIRSVMTWGMPPSFRELDRKGIEERLRQAGVRLKKGAAFLDGEDAVLNIQQPLLVAGGTEDTKWFFINGNAKRQLDMVEAIGKRGASKKVRFEILRGAPHGIDSKHECFNQFVDLVAEWFQDTLK